MEILYLLIPLSLVLVFVIGGVFWWALHSRQFEDLEQQGASILQEEAGEGNTTSAPNSAQAQGQSPAPQTEIRGG